MKPRLVELDSKLKRIAENTIGSNSLYYLCGHALSTNTQLSVVRMGDGEKLLWNQCSKGGDELVTPPEGLGDDWLKDLGCYGITRGELKKRLKWASEEATHYAPSISGLADPRYNLYGLIEKRKKYTDNFFCNAWDEDMKKELFQKAGSVLFIHRNTSTADAIQIRSVFGLGVKLKYIKLEDWKQTEGVIKAAHFDSAPLVIFSAGPAGKYIGPRISRGGWMKKVVLDIGHAADHWTFLSLKDVKRK